MLFSSPKTESYAHVVDKYGKSFIINTIKIIVICSYVNNFYNVSCNSYGMCLLCMTKRSYILSGQQTWIVNLFYL